MFGNDSSHTTRRAFLGQYAGSLGGLALAHLLTDEKSRSHAEDAPCPALGPSRSSVSSSTAARARWTCSTRSPS